MSEFSKKLHRIFEDNDMETPPKNQEKVDPSGGMDSEDNKTEKGTHKPDSPESFKQIKLNKEFENLDPTRKSSKLNK